MIPSDTAFGGTIPSRMTPAEMRMVREAWGLSSAELASYLSVNPRSVRAWESGKRPIPQGIKTSVEALEDRLVALVDELIEKAAGEQVLRIRSDGSGGILTARCWRLIAYAVSASVPGLRVTYTVESSTHPRQA